MLYGKVDPGGKLPVSFPRNEGQIPIYYNHEPTGRPCDPGQKYNSRHRDITSCGPLFEFGFGISYTTFKISNVTVSRKTMNAKNGTVVVSATVKNTGTKTGDEVPQLYVNDPVATITQPVRRLRGFERVSSRPARASGSRGRWAATTSATTTTPAGSSSRTAGSTSTSGSRRATTRTRPPSR